LSEEEEYERTRNIEKEVELIELPPAKDTHRWVAITALLLAIGVILHTISPNIGGVTPNWTIAMYSITIGLPIPVFPRHSGSVSSPV
jgi:energy-coupling factor transport system ATP-binding protein